MSNIYEVAKRAGVSTATVSRVMSQPNVVAPATRRRVLQAVERLGYEPNSTAKSLRTLRTELYTSPDISNPVFRSFFRASRTPRSARLPSGRDAATTSARKPPR